MRGRLALGGLFGDQRLRVYQDGRIEGSAILAPEMLRAPRRSSEPAASVVAGEGFEPPTSGLLVGFSDLISNGNTQY